MLEGIVISRFGLSATLNSISILGKSSSEIIRISLTGYIQKTQTEYLNPYRLGILSDNVCCRLCRFGWRYKVCTVSVH